MGTTSPARWSAPTTSPPGPKSPTATIGFTPRYFSVHSCSLPPSLLTTVRYSALSTVEIRCGGRGRPLAATTGAGADGGGTGVFAIGTVGAEGGEAGVPGLLACSGGALVSWPVGKKSA